MTRLTMAQALVRFLASQYTERTRNDPPWLSLVKLSSASAASESPRPRRQPCWGSSWRANVT